LIIGVPKEIKNSEYRVGITPGGAKEFINNGHTVIVESKAGEGSGFSDDEYIKAGCQIYTDVKCLFSDSDMIIKVNKPLPQEFGLLKKGHILLCFLYLAPDLELTEALTKAKIKGIAFETIELRNGSLPILRPMSEVAGRMAVQLGANLLQKFNGGSGVLLGGVPGVPPAHVTIIGGGIVGKNAAKMAVGLGARVTVLDINTTRLAYLDDLFRGRITTLPASEYNIEKAVKTADLLISGILIPGCISPIIVSEQMVKSMKKGSVIIDVSVDHGPSIETVDRITTHEDPYYIKHGILHYSVDNMAGAFPRTSTMALEAAILPYGLMLADLGLERAVAESDSLLKGLNIYDGHITYQGVAESHGLPYVNYNLLRRE
jgi:alanine dehydrogenase